MSKIPTKQIDGDVAIGRHVSMGGNATVRGDAVVDHDLKVKGWLEAKNIKSCNKGLFADASSLREAYPHPHDGWFAGVLASDEDIADLGLTAQEGKGFIRMYIGIGGDWVCSDKLYEISVDIAEVKSLKETVETVRTLATEAQSTADEALETAIEAQNDSAELHNSKGRPNGLAILDGDGLIPTRFIPGAMDDVKEFGGIVSGVVTRSQSSSKRSTDEGCMVVYDEDYARFLLYVYNLESLVLKGTYYTNWEDIYLYSTSAGVPHSDKIYVDKSTNRSYRWSGSQLAVIGSDLALGYTSSTAFPGDEGKQLQEDVVQANNDITEIHNNKGKPYGFVPLDENGLIAPKFIPEALIYEVTLRPEFSGEAPEALREAVQKHVTGQAYALRVKVSDSVTIDPDRPIIPSVPVVPGDTVSKGGDTLPDGGASAVDEDGVSSQADNDGEGRSLSLGITFEVLSTKEVAGTGDGESGIMYELLSVERFRGAVRMYFCTMTVYYNEDLSEVSVSLSPVASEAIYEKQEKLKDSEDVTVEGDKLSLTEQAKRALFDEMWVSIGGTKLDNGKYRINNGKELTFAEALTRYEINELVIQWNEAWKNIHRTSILGRYNESTSYFEGNGELYITAEQATRILDVGRIFCGSDKSLKYIYNLPTLLPATGDTYTDLKDSLSCITVNTIRIVDYYICNNLRNPDTTEITVTNTQSCFYLSRVKHILGILNVARDSSYLNHFYNSSFAVTETLWIKNLNKGINLGKAVNFRVDCLKYMVENAKETTGQTIVVHNDVYAKLTGDETNEAYTGLTDEEKAQWTALVPLAIEKNIAFATV